MGRYFRKLQGRVVSDLNIDEATAKKLVKKVADLKIQSMMFDMDIDYETLSLVPKIEYREPKWLSSWKEKVAQGDRQNADYPG